MRSCSALEAARRRPAWRRSTRCSRAATRAAPISPAASGSASRWHARSARSRWAPASSCSTSRRRSSTCAARREIFERILAATRHCTTILISHRFSTVRHADRICVLEKGKVVELGTHEELMALNGRYRTMFDLQAQRFSARGRGGQEPMTSSPEKPAAERRPAAGALLDVAAVQAGLPPRADADRRGVRAVAARGAARCAARVLVQAARRGRARAATGTASDWPCSRSAFPPRRPGSCKPSASACSAGSATR